jgi:oligoribonuclease
VDVVVKPPAQALEQMNAFVRDMHTSSGLLEELDAGVTLEEAQRTVLDYIKEWVPEPRKAPLGGNSVATDRGFLARDMPELEEWLHYRIIDVSSIKELSRRWYPRAYFAAPAKSGGHRALADIRESIAELRYYREAVFVPPPGQDSATLRSIARNHVVDHGSSASGAVTSTP